MDASTAILHHPLEFGLTALIAVAWVVLLGVPGIVIYVHYAISQGFTFWQHANINPLPGQRSPSCFFVVPELHEVRHSVRPEHHNTNYGVIFSFWDRLFGTLIDDLSIDDTIECGLEKSYWEHPLTVTPRIFDPFRRTGNRNSQSEMEKIYDRWVCADPCRCCGYRRSGVGAAAQEYERN